MKRIICIIISALIILCSCHHNIGTSPVSSVNNDKSLVGKWIDVKTEKIFEYTDDGFYYEYLNESFTTDKTRYTAIDGKITYYLDGDKPESGYSVDYEIKNGHLIIAGEIEYRPMTIKTSIEEME